jgi:hypothetical protein
MARSAAFALGSLLTAARLGLPQPTPPTIRESAEAVVLHNDRLTMTLGKPQMGAIGSLVDRATGHELIAKQAQPRLFTLAFRNADDINGERVYASNTDARDTQFDVETGDGRSMCRLRYEDLRGLGISCACTATVTAGEPAVRWTLSARFPASLVLEEVQFPYIVVRAPLVDGEDDAAVMGHTKGGIHRRPSKLKPNAALSASQPGTMAAQFGCYYTRTVGLYTAAYDNRGYPKRLVMRRTEEGLELHWGHYCLTSEPFQLGYDLAYASFSAAGRDRPTDWRHAADIYKAWAEKQPWCRRTYAERRDVPDWLKSGPAMVRFGRQWLADSPTIEKWLTEYWHRFFPDGPPLICAYWGWEKVDSWVTPDYFPVFPSDEEFTRIAQVNRRFNGHVFPWPSGYHYTRTYRARENGTFEWDDRERFDRVARPHAVHNRDGTLFLRKASWLRGGENACMCPGDPWTIDWLNDIAIELVKRGADMIQVDQVVGGSFPPCYSTSHDHPPGPGLWMTEVFRKQLRTMLRRCRQIDPQAIVCFEEPNEHFIQQAAIQDYRDWEVLHREPTREPASVFNYIYHEYLPTFQSNPRPGDKLMAAYCLVNGQIPHFVPSQAIGPGPLLEDGDFEEWSGEGLVGWSKVDEYKGVVWRGSFSRDTVERHGGESSLRLENVAADDIVQVSQNVAMGPTFRGGGTYRLSAWMKSRGLAKPNNIALGTFTSEWQNTGSWHIPMPQDEAAGWVRGEATFTVPEGSKQLRIMLHVEGPGQVWVDDVQLEEVGEDGTTTPVMRPETPPEHDLMKQWIDLFSGAGRPYLLLGRMLHPPKLELATPEPVAHDFPPILHNAFRAPDGSEAVVLVNVTDDDQAGRLHWNGQAMPITLRPWEVQLIAG